MVALRLLAWNLRLSLVFALFIFSGFLDSSVIFSLVALVRLAWNLRPPLVFIRSVFSGFMYSLVILSLLFFY